MAKTILVVDDSASIRQIVSIVLQGAGYHVIESCDGRDALNKLDGRKIDLIISDINMPRMDGFTFVREVKQLVDYQLIPIILLTTESQEAKKQEGRAAGAKAWVVKPFKPENMLQTVGKLLLA